MDKSILQQINHWAACARLTSECSSVVHADLLEKVASHIISIESLQEETQKERDDLKELNCHFDLSIRKTEGISEVLRSKLEAAERALIKPLPIGELVHRLEGQTYEKWFSESDVKDLLERAQKAEAALSAANEKLNQVITDDWNEIGPTYPAHYTPVIVAMNGVTQYITYQIEEGDNGDYWQPVCNEDGEGAPITQFQHWKPLPADFVVEGNADAE